MSTEILNQKETFVGGWTSYHTLTNEDRKVFDEAMNGFVGVSYTPNEIATQIVAGVNYRFKCTASIPPSDVIWEAIVEIYQPLGDQKPHITNITKL